MIPNIYYSRFRYSKTNIIGFLLLFRCSKNLLPAPINLFRIPLQRQCDLCFRKTIIFRFFPPRMARLIIDVRGSSLWENRYNFYPKRFPLNLGDRKLRTATDDPLNSHGPSAHPWANIAQFDCKRRVWTQNPVWYFLSVFLNITQVLIEVREKLW